MINNYKMQKKLCINNTNLNGIYLLSKGHIAINYKMKKMN